MGYGYIPSYVIHVGSCWIFTYLIEDFANDLPKLNMHLSTNENLQTFRAGFCNIFRRYSDARQLSEELCDLSINIEFCI